MSAAETRENVAIAVLSCACTFAVIWPLVAHEGVPLFAHDWTWSPYAARSVWNWQLLLSSWTEVGLGEPNSAISVNPLAWSKVALPLVLSGRTSQLAYLAASLVALGLATYRIARRNLGASRGIAWIAVPILVTSPFVFDKIASGQSSYWAGFAAFAWGVSLALDAFETGAASRTLAAGACFALASVQLQFLAFAWIAFAVGLAVRRSRSAVAVALGGIVTSSTLAFPAVYFLARRGALEGAQISPPYRSWLSALSATPGDATAMLGYVSHYAEWALGDPRTIDLTHVAAYALAVAAVLATLVASRRANAWTLALLGALGWWWVTGVDGLFGGARSALILHVADAGFFREFYHAGALYALALATLGTLGIERITDRARVLRFPVALGLVAALGAAAWSGGLGRVLAFSAGDDAPERLAAAVGPDEARVLFLPARQPLRTRDDAIGGNDGLDWIDARHHSIYEYYLPPLVSTAIAALASGDAATARRVLARLDVSAVVDRTYLTSGDASRASVAADRSRSTLRAAFGAPVETSPGTSVYKNPHAPMLAVATALVPLPPNATAPLPDARAVFADVAGRDAGTFATNLDRTTPDARDGWILRRDVPLLDAASIGSPFYGIATERPGATVALHDVPAGNVVAWNPDGMSRRTVAAGDLRIVARGPAAITEVGERALPARRLSGAATLDAVAHDAPWAYRATVHLSGRTALVLRERYDENWRLEAPARLRIERRFRADGFANAWIVEGRGTFPIRVTYAAQTTANALLGTSLVAFVATVTGAFLTARA